MESRSADIVIIGSGPAGQKAAMQAAKLKKRVVVIEKPYQIGGACLHSGTIPSKTLRAGILDLTQFYLRSFYMKDQPPRDIKIGDLICRLEAVIDMQSKMIDRQFRKNNVELIYGHASFESANVVVVKNAEGDLSHKIHAEFVLIAAGSSPRNPPDIPFDHKHILDSTSLLSIDRLPKSMIVLGGGVIGSEYASFFAALGVEVTVIDKKEHMLPRLDREIGIHLQNGLSDIGLKFVGNKLLKEVGVDNNRAFVRCEDGTQLEAEILLYALGREANVSDLHIENAGITLTSRGYIYTNNLYQTTTPNVYAVGDVIGGASLASTSMEQGRLAALSMCGHKTHHFPDIYPLGIYTIPEISCCGYTEEEVQKMGYNYKIGRAYYYEIAASQIYGSNNMGMFKIIFHAETLQILGVHIVGHQATEVIHIGQVAMNFNCKIDFFIDQVFNYPTYAEGYRIAALNGCNKI